MERLHEQLKSLKVFKFNRLKKDGKMGLVDSGATHPLRARRDNEEVDGYAGAEVFLADGRTVAEDISRRSHADRGQRCGADRPHGPLGDEGNCKMCWGERELEEEKVGCWKLMF